jgi:hypothetical protein
MFVEGGGTQGRPELAGRPIVPLEWLMSHPATYPWISESVDSNLGAPVQTRTMHQFDAGYAGVVVHVVALGHAGVQGANAGINYAIIVNKAPVFRCTRLVANNPQNNNSFDYLDAGDGFGNSWADIRVWVEEGGLVEVTYNNNGGASDTMGMVLRGYGWPVAIYEEWISRGWRK